MSLQQTAYVTRANVPSRETLQAAIDSLGFECEIDALNVPFGRSGYLPCLLTGRESGFEIYFESASVVLADFPGLVKVVGDRDVAISFRWGGDIAECACVLIVSAALVKSCGAVVHYQDDDMLYSAEQLLEDARTAVQSL